MPQTILLVDGDVAVRNDALRNAGFEILETSNGAEALKLASECQPTLIVLAIELSGADGFAICKLLKSNPLTASIPVLHLSNAQSDCGYLESAESGAEGYLQEPVQPSVLVGVVKALIHARSVRATMRKAEQEGLAKDSLAALIATIPDEVWFANEQGRLALANPSALREFKMGPPNTVLVEELAESLKVLRADGTPRPAEEAPLLRALGGETVRNQEEIVRTPIHGELRYRQVSASPVRDAVGSIVGSVSVVRDVTSQKLAEQALRASEERLRLFVEYAPAAIAILDRQMRYVAFSRRWLEDYLPGEQDLTGRSHYDVFPELPERWKEIHRRCLAGAVEKCDEDMFPRLDGKLDWVRWEIHPWRNEKGEIEGITIFSEVITERKRAEAALRESEDQFRTLANAIPQLCWMAKADGWIFWYNERWYAYTGTTPEQMEGWGWQSVHDSAALPKVLDRWQASIATGKPFDMVFPLRGTDGEFRPFLTRVMPVRDQDGSVVSWFGTNTDISEQRRTEQALATSESRLRALLESAAQGVVAVDETGRILLVNARTEELFGYSRDEVIGQPLDLLVPEHLQASHAVHQREYFANPRTRQMGAGLDLQGRKKDGGDISVEISLSFVEEGGKRLALALITDVTERKQAEDLLLQTQKLESLGLLAGGVAHDFNNLLVGVIGNASIAQEMLPPDHPAVELLDGILKTGEQAAHLTRQMLAYSGKGKFMVEPLNLSKLIPDMSSLVRRSIPKKIALRLDLEEDLPAIEADRGQIQQVFMNLALNAAEAIGSQEGLITVKTGTQEVHAAYVRLHPGTEALPPGKYVFFDVRDTGCGMDPATKAKIFDPFFSTKFTGRGLGLAAVSGILRGHSAGITVSSSPGEGSCFTVLFPATAGAAVNPPVAAHASAARGGGVILVVDDEEIVREMAKRALERQGYTVLLADSGAAAINIFKKDPADISLVVLDLNMPHMSGEEALPELRKIRPKVKFLVSSGYSEAEVMSQFKGQRVAGFVQKPYASKGIVEKVQACLG